MNLQVDFSDFRGSFVKALIGKKNKGVVQKEFSIQKEGLIGFTDIGDHLHCNFLIKKNNRILEHITLFYYMGKRLNPVKIPLVSGKWLIKSNPAGFSGVLNIEPVTNFPYPGVTHIFNFVNKSGEIFFQGFLKTQISIINEKINYSILLKPLEQYSQFPLKILSYHCSNVCNIPFYHFYLDNLDMQVKISDRFIECQVIYASDPIKVSIKKYEVSGNECELLKRVSEIVKSLRNNKGVILCDLKISQMDSNVIYYYNKADIYQALGDIRYGKLILERLI